ncbi:MAG: hypothetical protein WAO56_10230 [Miniphocaeibacter sp.]|uniref:hypothetical protein n=1 Tax=Miniphocaeibacter sp. TaxID=3100973 RepID=UPI0017A5E986|nr:hypothetical protein [Gallicola sp.]
MDKKTSDAQLKATRNWEKRNKEKAKIGSYRRTARLFIKTYATLEDIEELKGLIDERIKVIQEDK